MITKKCVQCGKNFTISDSETEFFKSKNLTIPKRCKQCREANKNGYAVHKDSNSAVTYDTYSVSTPLPDEAKIFLFLSFVITLSVMFIDTSTPLKFISLSVFAIIIIVGLIYTFLNKTIIQEFDTSIYKYTFYDTVSMVEHYAKHRKQVECNSMEAYLLKANMVILDKGSCTKHTKKNDLAYFNQRTNEFVIVAKAGYIRTYFIANQRYFDKQ